VNWVGSDHNVTPDAALPPASGTHDAPFTHGPIISRTGNVQLSLHQSSAGHGRYDRRFEQAVRLAGPPPPGFHGGGALCLRPALPVTSVHSRRSRILRLRMNCPALFAVNLLSLLALCLPAPVRAAVIGFALPKSADAVAAVAADTLAPIAANRRSAPSIRIGRSESQAEAARAQRLASIPGLVGVVGHAGAGARPLRLRSTAAGVQRSSPRDEPPVERTGTVGAPRWCPMTPRRRVYRHLGAERSARGASRPST
jgi:hypothetical protein